MTPQTHLSIGGYTRYKVSLVHEVVLSLLSSFLSFVIRSYATFVMRLSSDGELPFRAQDTL